MRKIFSYILFFFGFIKTEYYWLNSIFSNKFCLQRTTAMLIKNIHRIEKGLSLCSPRSKFGVQTIEKIIKLSSKIINNYGTKHMVLYMARDVVNAWLNLYKSEDFYSLRRMASDLFSVLSVSKEPASGILHIRKEDVYYYDMVYFERFVKSRHSVRDFDSDNVNDEDIYDAIELAKYAPSACNRQTTGVYIAKDTNKEKVGKYFGIMGFENIDKFLIVTSNVAAYSYAEKYDWFMSSGIFSGYLILSLHSKGIASCILRVPLYNTPSNQTLKEILEIPYNEQIVLCVAIGAYKDEFNVALSKRFNCDLI